MAASHRCFAVLVALGSLVVATVHAKLLNIDNEDEDRTEPPSQQHAAPAQQVLQLQQVQQAPEWLEAVNDFVSERLRGGVDLDDSTKSAITQTISSAEERKKRERLEKKAAKEAQASTTPERTKKPAKKSAGGRPSFTARTGTAREKLKNIETELEDVQKKKSEMEHKVEQTKASVEQLSASFAKHYEGGTGFGGRVKDAQDMLTKSEHVAKKNPSEHVAALELQIKTVMDKAFAAEQQMMKDVAALETQLATDTKKASQDRAMDTIVGVIARTGAADAAADA